MSAFRLATPSPSIDSPTPGRRDSPSPSTLSTFSDDDDDDDLPYPTELPRADFLDLEFDAQTYLSSLRNRHQTLEDLRADLRTRSQLLNRELLELVNGHYEAFLSLGGDLRGGEERVENVRVGVLGFEREIRSLSGLVKERELEVKGLLQERQGVRQDVVLGRTLLEVGERVGDLERIMGLARAEDHGEIDLEEEDLDDEEEVDEDDVNGIWQTSGASISTIRKHAHELVLIARMVERIGPSHPFLVSLRPRLQDLRKTVLIDLASALRQARAAKAPDDIIAIINVYSDLGAESESIKVLKGA